MKTFDVVIVGAGPAGSSLAAYLADSGLETLLVDKQRFPRDKVCGDILSPRALRHLDDLDCLVPLENSGYFKIRKCATFLDGEPLSDGYLPAVPGYVDHSYAVPRYILDNLLFEHALTLGVDSLQDCRVSGFTTNADGVVIDAQTADGEVRTLKSRFIVGADGSQSVVAKSAGITRDDRHVSAVMRGYGYDYPLREAILYYTRDYFPGFAWAVPIKDGRINFGVGMMSETIKKYRLSLPRFFEEARDFLLRMAAERDFTGASIATPKGWSIGVYGGASASYFDRGLLIGDAGCFADPLNGEGIPVAMETAKMASVRIMEAFSASDFSAAFLSEYEQRWRQEYDLDHGLSNLMLTASRNRDLVDIWLSSMKTMSQTASRDRSFALQAGGMLTGILPARIGLDPGFFLKPLLSDPSSWLRNLDGEAMRWSMDRWRNAVDDPEWTSSWLMEMSEKQAGVMRALARQAGVG